MAKGRNSLTIKADTSDLQAYLRNLEVNMRQAARPIAQAGAQVLYDEARRLAPVGERAFHFFYGTSWKKYGTKYRFERGSLKGSVYQVYSKDASIGPRATYHVSYNWKEAPYAGFVEWGTTKMPPKSFIRAAAINKYDQAVEAMKAKALEELQGQKQGEPK
jgi:HK97 gp10 family phage protein